MNFKELYAEQKNVIWTVLILAVLVVGFLTIAPQVFHASSSVNGRNLPIYCVETDEKKVALSFIRFHTVYGKLFSVDCA